MYKPKRKLYLIIFLGVIVAFTIFSVIYVVDKKSDEIIRVLTLDRVKSANISFVNYINELKERVITRADVIAGNEIIVDAVKNNDYRLLERILHGSLMGMNFASISNSQGIILASSNGESIGNDITYSKGASKAIRTGKTAVSIEEIRSIGNRLSVYACAPLYEADELIGIVSFFYDLTNNDHVDNFKAQTGCEATIFLKDKRISTTIRDESDERAVGSFANDFVTDAVIGQREEYQGYMEIYGKTYGVCYSPLLINDEIIGMLFTGVNIDYATLSHRTMNSWIIFAYLTGIIILVAYIIVSNIFARRYAVFSEKQRDQQVLMASISQSFLSDSDTDALITTTLLMVGECMDAPQILLYWLESDGLTLTCRNEWISPKLGLSSRVGGKITLQEPALSIMKKLDSGGGIDSCLFSSDSVFNQAILPYRVNFKNYIITPVYIKSGMCGIIDYSKPDNKKWNRSDISLAMLFASTLSGVFEREAMGRRTSIVENSPIMIFYSDANNNLAYANPAAVTVTGYSLAELKAGGFKLISDFHSERIIKKEFFQQKNKDNIEKHDSILICKNGCRRLLEVTSFILKDNMIAAICIDLTEKHELEFELIKAKDNAERASQAKGNFLSTMSHEIRTPMNAIIGMTAIAKNAVNIEQKDQALGKIEKASTHLLGIINDVLDMSKIEANKFELTYAEFELRSLVLKAVTFVHFRMEEKQQEFSMNVDENIPYNFIGDDQRLTQILTNLLSNAIKFTPEGGRIGINVFFVREENNYYELRFEVVDSGIGISPEQQEKIFFTFEQAESGITRKYGGTGLGLPISKRIIELMGGKITVESEPGKGSRFIFTVILQRGTAGSSGSSHDDGIFDLNKKNEFFGRKILLVEDIEINREILITLLQNTGLIIDIAENGKEALEKVTAAPDEYELILMDMQMPVMDGLESTRNIRTLESKLYNNDTDILRHVPIIAMTANVFKDDIENCLKAGMDDHIGKPLDLSLLLIKLRKYL